MTEKIKPQGLRTFKAHEKAPSFVKGTLLITIDEFTDWLKENESLLTEYNGKKQLRCQILDSDKGLYLVVDTFKPTSKGVTKDDLPF